MILFSALISERFLTYYFNILRCNILIFIHKLKSLFLLYFIVFLLKKIKILLKYNKNNIIDLKFL